MKIWKDFDLHSPNQLLCSTERNRISCFSEIVDTYSAAFQPTLALPYSLSMISDLVTAVKACLPRGPTVANPEVLPCLAFSILPAHLLSTERSNSMFGNEEICRFVPRFNINTPTLQVQSAFISVGISWTMIFFNVCRKAVIVDAKWSTSSPLMLSPGITIFVPKLSTTKL